MIRKILFIVFSLFLLGAAAGMYLAWDAYQYLHSPVQNIQKEESLFDVEKGATFGATLGRLRDSGWISRPRVFYYWARLNRQMEKLKMGTYLLSPSMTPIEILHKLTSGISATRLATIPEGYNIFQVADVLVKEKLVEREDFLKQVKSEEFTRELGIPAETFEGYLFPDTYHFPLRTDARDIIRQMVARFREVWREEWERAGEAFGMSRHDVVKLASIIEKETGAPWERKTISSVFHNRISRKMPLGTDPTIIYGMMLEGRYDGNIRWSDLRERHPYNSRIFRGLPPTPIANPGKESLEAAVSPEKTDYLFFVSRNDGTHVFTRSYEEHKKKVEKFQKNPKAREGKSWRDLRARSREREKED